MGKSYANMFAGIGLFVPCLLGAVANISFDAVEFSGVRTTDTNYGADPSDDQYVGVYTDSVNNLKVRFTLIDIIGGGGTKPEGSYEHALATDNATVGVTYDFDKSGNEKSTDDGFFETGPDNPGIFTRYRVDFLNTDDSDRAPDDYRLSIFDIDHTPEERIELVQIENQYITSEVRWRQDGSIVSENYTGDTIYENPDLVSEAPQDVSFVERRANETLDGVEFRTFAGLANFSENEKSANASPMGGVSVVLSGVQSFEIIVGAESTEFDARTRARFILDFGDPPDNGQVVVPEAKLSAFLMGLIALGASLRRRRPASKSVEFPQNP